MAALDYIHELTATVSIAREIESIQATSPLTPRSFPRRDEPQTVPYRAGNGLATAPVIDPTEKGDEDERNEAVTVETDRGRNIEDTTTVDDGEGSRVRSELARDLMQRVDVLLPLVGDVGLATSIQLLKRDLSHCHDTLASFPTEGSYLSIITLVESATSQTRWKDFTRTQLQSIKNALETGYRQVRVGFGDYERVRTSLKIEHVDATPRIDLASLTLDDIKDEQEE